jgi:glycosyltransferase involved in cell wall biosynthesis
MLLLNYRPVLRQPTGIGVYANGVLPALQSLEHTLIPGGGEGGAKERLKRLAWSQGRLPERARQAGASLIFTPAPEGYLGRQTIPQVVMVHDLRPISHPECSLQSLYFRAWVPPLLRSCQRVITNSQFTAAEIERHTGLPASRIAVIPLGYDDQLFRPASPGAPRQPPSVRESLNGPYLLHLGQAYPHKNLERLIRAFAQVAPHHPELNLLLAGKPHASETPRLQGLVETLQLQGRVHFVAYVPYDQLADLYRDALALAYPSLWEGFGLPVLEAMACGTPVLTSVGSGTGEVAGDAALLVNPTDTGAIAEALESLASQPQLRADLIRRGLVRAAGFSWQRTGAATRELLGRLG